VKPVPAPQSPVAADRLRAIVAAVLDMDAGEITTDASFYGDLAADSLEKIEIAVRIERAFAIRLDPDEVAALGSVQDALALLRDKGAVA
jgi:acyl carrier protein